MRIRLARFVSTAAVLVSTTVTTTQAFVVAVDPLFSHPSPRSTLARIPTKTGVSVNLPSPAPLSSSSSLATTTTRLYGSADKNSKNDESSLSNDLPKIQALPAVAWIALVFFAFGPWAPGNLMDSFDLLPLILADPVHPEGVNLLFYALFNVFLPLPFLLAALVLPQSSPTFDRCHAIPALALSAALGYFALGPYLSLRSTGHPPSFSWFTRSVTERKTVNVLILVTLLYLPWAVDLSTAWSADAAAVWQDFIHLLSTNRFAATSCLDLTLLQVTMAALIPADYRLRTAHNNNNRDDEISVTGNQIALAALVVPFLGPALYCVLRPPLFKTLINSDGNEN